MTRNRTGSLTAATWLIGLGIVFLVQRAADLPWSQAWPMFLILVGVASFVTTILHGRYVYGGLWAFTWPVAWIVVGSILLASTTGTDRHGTRAAHRRLLAVGAGDPRHLVRDRRVRAQRPGPDRDAPAAARRRIGGTRPDRLRGRQPGGRLGGPGSARRRPVRGRRHPPDDGRGRRRADPGQGLRDDLARAAIAVDDGADDRGPARPQGGYRSQQGDPRPRGPAAAPAWTSTPARARRGSCCRGRPGRRRSPPRPARPRSRSRSRPGWRRGSGRGWRWGAARSTRSGSR